MNNLVRLRKIKGLTQEELGGAIGSDGNSVSRYERGIVRPSIEITKKIADFFGVTVDELLNGPTQEKFTVEIEFVKTLEGVEETMQMNGIRLVIGEDGYLGVAGGMKFSGQGDIEKVLSEIRFKLEHGLGAQKQMEEERKRLNG